MIFKMLTQVEKLKIESASKGIKRGRPAAEFKTYVLRNADENWVVRRVAGSCGL